MYTRYDIATAAVPAGRSYVLPTMCGYSVTYMVYTNTKSHKCATARQQTAGDRQQVAYGTQQQLEGRRTLAVLAYTDVQK